MKYIKLKYWGGGGGRTTPGKQQKPAKPRSE